MRVLFGLASGVGHVQPVLPLAVAMRARRHEVRWVTAERGCRRGGESGIEARLTEYERRWPAYAALPGETRAEKMLPRLFGDIAGQAMFPPLLDIARR